MLEYESGTATTYISRNKALKKLQLSLPSFRRLCILKGIYPHEPRHIKKANKGSTAARTFYMRKDIQFLLNEPLINKFREFKIFIRKYKKALNKNNRSKAQLLKKLKPKYKLDHIIKERYPSFIDAVRDLDDCLSMIFLFAKFPSTKVTRTGLVNTCKRLSVEFMNYVVASKSLRKVFVSIKGYYYQGEIMGEQITWVVPHELPFEHPKDVDYKIMLTFTEFATQLLGFINFKLYNSANLIYPPKIIHDKHEGNWDGNNTCIELCNSNEKFQEKLSTLAYPLEEVINSVDTAVENDMEELLKQENDEKLDEFLVEEQKKEQIKNLFKGLKFFLNREVPKEALTFAIRNCSGLVSWDYTTAPGASFEEKDDTITHQIIDRPKLEVMHINRSYIQPQWIFDSINKCELLPISSYLIGAELPPHLSPFVNYDDKYVPPEAKPDYVAEEVVQGDSESEIDSVENDEGSDIVVTEEETEDDDDASSNNENSMEETIPTSSELKEEKKAKMAVTKGRVKKTLSAAEVEDQEKRENLKLAEMMQSKKHKHVYKKIMFGKKRLEREKRVLEEKRKAIDDDKRKTKKRKTVAI